MADVLRSALFGKYTAQHGIESVPVDPGTGADPSVYNFQTRTGLVSTPDCLSVATGQVADYLSNGVCQNVDRLLATTNVDGRPVLVALARVAINSMAGATGLIPLIRRNGTGDIEDLISSGVRIDGGPAKFASDPTFLAQPERGEPDTIDVLEAMWLDGPTHASDAQLEPVLASAARQL